MQKVNVTTVDDVKISRWRWWSNWIDVCVVEFNYQGYLLQMAVSRTNSKKFKLVAFKAGYNMANCGARVGDLTQMRGEKQ